MLITGQIGLGQLELGSSSVDLGLRLIDSLGNILRIDRHQDVAGMDLRAELDVAGRNAAAGLEGQITLVTAFDGPRIGSSRRTRPFAADLDGLDQLGLFGLLRLLAAACQAEGCHDGHGCSRIFPICFHTFISFCGSSGATSASTALSAT